ncbi:MAG: extracellular solute-binding protein [Fimbriimonas sp.]|nr:extracellular solute-binding protein [Fimbriimonas sp.]
MHRSTYGIVAIAGLFAALLACGCGRGGDASSDQDKTIRVVRNIGGREGFRIHFNAWKKAFEGKNPGWKMELVDLGDNDGAATYKQRIAADEMPEVIMTWALTKFLVDNDVVQPIPDSFYEKYGIPKGTPYKGKQYCSQGGLQFQGMAVNRKMWASIGVTTPPKTWDEFVGDLRKLKAKGYVPLVYGARDWTGFMPLTMELQVNMYDYAPIPGRPSWTAQRNSGKTKFATDPIAQLVMKNMVALMDEFAEKGALSDGYPEEQRMFYGGKGATWIMGCWIAGDIEAQKITEDIDYWPLPSMVGRLPAFLEYKNMQSGWAINSKLKGEKLDKAMAVLDAFYDPQVHQLYLNGEGMFKLATKVPIDGPMSTWPPAQTLFDRMGTELKQWQGAAGWQLALDDMPPDSVAWERPMQEILSGNKDVGKLLQILDEEWDRGRKGQ